MSEQAPSTPEIVQYPLLPLRDVVVFPHMVIPLFVGRPKSIKAMETAMEAGKSILLVAQKSAAKDDPGPQDMYAIGCVSNILQMLKLPDGTVKVLVEGGTRAHIRDVVDVRTHWVAEAAPVAGEGDPEGARRRRRGRGPRGDGEAHQARAHAEGRAQEGRVRAQEIEADVAHVRGSDGGAQLHRDHRQPSLEEEVEDLEGHQRRPTDPGQGSLWAGENQR